MGPVGPTGPGRPAAPGAPGGPMGPGLPGDPVGPGSPREPTDVSWDLHAPPRRITRPFGFWQSIAPAPAAFTASTSPNTMAGAIIPAAARFRFGRAEGIVSLFAISASLGLPRVGRRPARTKSVVLPPERCSEMSKRHSGARWYRLMWKCSGSCEPGDAAIPQGAREARSPHGDLENVLKDRQHAALWDADAGEALAAAEHAW